MENLKKKFSLNNQKGLSKREKKTRFMENPKSSHWLVAKRILRYLNGTTDFGILYKRGSRIAGLLSYTDNNYDGDLDDRKSTSGFAFIMGSGAISWASKKQQVVSLSTTEAEYIAAAFCACQCIWLRRILKQLGAEERGST
ncbi:secreted RxLR effector protein 161-like [Primulina tabacum]|uniref:secreted RxLR effector protein 161-like n=1 Tax=Primulina tabacum TaxID=48773 RepID=UPI003F595122